MPTSPSKLTKPTARAVSAWIQRQGQDRSAFLFPNARGGRLSADLEALFGLRPNMLRSGPTKGRWGYVAFRELRR